MLSIVLFEISNAILGLSGKVLGMFFSFIDFCIFAL